MLNGYRRGLGASASVTSVLMASARDGIAPGCLRRQSSKAFSHSAEARISKRSSFMAMYVQTVDTGHK